MNRRTFLQTTGIVLIGSTTLAGEKEIPIKRVKDFKLCQISFGRKWYHSNKKMPKIGTNIIKYHPFSNCATRRVEVGEVLKIRNPELRIVMRDIFSYFYYKEKWNGHQKDTIYFRKYVSEEDKKLCLNIPWVIIDEIRKPGTDYSWDYKQEEYDAYDSFLWMDLGNNPLKNIPKELPKIPREKWDKL